MEMPGRNTEDGTKKREELRSDDRRTAFLRYHDERLQYAIATGNRSTLLDAALSHKIFTDGNKSYFDGFIDHDRSEIPLEQREAAINSTIIVKEYGATVDEAREALKRLEQMGEIVFIRKYQPKKKKKLCLSVYKHALFECPEWADMLYKSKFRPHETQKIAKEYGKYSKSKTGQAKQNPDPMEQNPDPMKPQKTVENGDFLDGSAEQNPTQFYKSNSMKTETSIYSNKGAEITVEDKAAEEAPQASIQPPPINSRQWMELNIGIRPAAINSCTDESETAELEKLAYAMRHGATDFAKVDACAEILLHLHRMNRLPPWATAPRQGIGL